MKEERVWGCRPRTYPTNISVTQVKVLQVYKIRKVRDLFQEITSHCVFKVPDDVVPDGLYIGQFPKSSLSSSLCVSHKGRLKS